MRTILILLGSVGLLALVQPVFAQDETASTDAVSSPLAADAGTPAELERETLESEFRKRLTRAVFRGRWALIEEGELGPEREESYRIMSVTKVAGDLWIITARIQYAGRDITAPVPVRVRWAGDTPVLMVDNVPIPGSGTYSARVMIFGDTYAGSWSGGERGGLMNGLIQRPDTDP
jgi:hypothetical protein